MAFPHHLEDHGYEDAVSDARMERQAAAALRRAQREEPPDDAEPEDAPYCVCGNTPTIEEEDWNTCACCGKELHP